MAEALLERGYVDTSVAEVLKRARVSRETFYQLYPSKLACFLDAFDTASAILVDQLGRALGDGGTAAGESATPAARFEQVLTIYLTTLAEHPAYARLFLVEVHAAGPEAMARRAAVQDLLVDALVGLVGARSDEDRFACRALVAATASMVVGPLVAGDVDALTALGPPLVAQARRTFGW
jgi:AcrR family transcriptional regulator